MVPPPPCTRALLTAQLGASVTVGSTSMPAERRPFDDRVRAAPFHRAPVLGLQRGPIEGDARAFDAASGEALELFGVERRLGDHAPELRRQRLGGRGERESGDQRHRRHRAHASSSRESSSPRPRGQLAFGETWLPGPRRWRRCLTMTAPIEIAARARDRDQDRDQRRGCATAGSGGSGRRRLAFPGLRGCLLAAVGSRCLGYPGRCPRCPYQEMSLTSKTRCQARPSRRSPTAPRSYGLQSSFRGGSSFVQVRRRFRREPRPGST